MGLLNSKTEFIKHVVFDGANLKQGSEEFRQIRKNFDKGEYKSLEEAENFDKYEMLSPTEREIVVHIKRTTFLEPLIAEHTQLKDVFRRKSVQSEMNEFTYAKALLEEKKSHRLERFDNSEYKVHKRKKSEKRTKKKSHKKNLSHEFC